METAPKFRRRARGVYDGQNVILYEPLDVPLNTEMEFEIRILADQVTWASKRLGLPNLKVKGDGPSASDIIVEERR